MIKIIGKQLSYGVLAQLITFILTPFVTRIYSPEEFGIFNNVVLWAGFLMPVMALSLPTSIVLQKTDNMVLRASRACIYISISLYIMLSLLMFIFSFVISSNVFHYLLFSSLLAFVLNVNDIFAYNFIRMNKLKLRGILLLFQATLAAALKIAIGVKISAYESLVFSTLASYIFCFLLFFNETSPLCKKTKASDIRFFIIKHSAIVKYRMPQNLITAGNQLVPILLITSFYGAVMAGYYALARTIIVMPYNVLGRAVQDVLYPRFNAKVNHREKISPEISRLILFSFIISLFPIFIFFFYGELLFGFIFGGEWEISGLFAFWIVIPNVVTFLNKPLVALVSILKMEKYLLANSVFLLFINFFSFCLLPLIGLSGKDTVMIGSVLATFPQFVLSYVCLREVYTYEKKCSSVRGL